MSGAMRAGDRARRVRTVARREVVTVARSPAAAALAVAFFGIVVGITLVGDGHERGFVPTIFDLLTPVELLVPLLAVALAYRSILGDATRGELELLRATPLTAGEHVVGAFLGRAAVVVGIVLGTLAVVGGLVAVTPPETVRVFATHETADSPVFFVRFMVLSLSLAVTFVAVGLAVSAVATSSRTAIALVATVILLVFVGIELAIVRALATGALPEGWLARMLGLGPLSAYRGLVLETAVAIDPGAPVRAASPVISALGLLAWTVGSLTVATVVRQYRS